MIKSIFAAGIAAVSIAAPAIAVPLSDVQPTNWAFAAIQSLNDKYGCVAGYPDGTFKPTQPTTRAQAAALVNACIDRISEFQNAADAQLVAALKSQAAQWSGVNARVAKLELADAQKKTGVGNYLGLGVLLNNVGTGGSPSDTVSGGTLQARYAVKNFSNNNAVSVRPYINAVAGPNSQIGAAGGLLATYDYSVAKRGGVSSANVYGGVGYQTPFTQYTGANYQSAIGNRGQIVLAVGVEGRITDSLVGYSQLTFPTTNAANSYGATNGVYSPVLTGGIGVKF
jgi:hypothetical protein